MILGVSRRVFEFHKRRYGSRRIQSELQDQGYDIGRHQISQRMKELGLIAIQPKSYVPKTTQSHPHLKRMPNLLLEFDNQPTAPDQVFVGDITYLPNEEQGFDKWLYLMVWMDLFTRLIVGWQIERHMEESLVLKATRQLIRRRQPDAGTILHTDGGGQFGGHGFRGLLEVHNFRQSMTRKDNHYDNAFIESLFSRFKAEELDGGVFYGYDDAYYRTFEFIEGYYNTIRKHSALGQISPMQFEERFWKQEL